MRLVLYPGEGHGNRNATARLDYNLRQLRWFEKYLRDKPVDMGTTVTPIEFPSAADWSSAAEFRYLQLLIGVQMLNFRYLQLMTAAEF